MSRKHISNEEFIAKAREIHGDKYDYSKVKYVNAKTKVCIVCPEHGEFWQTPDSHLHGSGCSKCVGNVRMTTEEFISKAREIHGNKYDYSKVEYVNIGTKVCIICPEHGEFWQSPNKHLQGQGCSECLGKVRNTEQFITKAREIHGDKYDYSKVVYAGAENKVCIICPEHGEWYTLPGNLLHGFGCPQCGKERAREASIKWTKESFIAKAREVHGDKYDYSKVEYVNLKTKVCIICPEHGEFWQMPIGHLNGKGCGKCAGNARLAAEEFIARAREIHGDKYDYSKVEYLGVDTKVCIICPEHGEFWQRPAHHLKGQGCKKCGQRAIADSQRGSTEEFVARAREVHGDKYDYSKVNYVSSQAKVCIICPEHGEFWMQPSNHLNGQGCPRCSFPNKHLTEEEFITKAREVHGNKYDYSKVEFTNATTRVCIICPEHGEFWKTPSEHIRGAGCPKCNKMAMASAMTKTTEEFISRAREIHGDKYDYSKVEYVKANKKVCIICPVHGEFWQTPNGHLDGRGCQKCGGRVKLTTEEFIAKAREVHGDRYDYSKTDYVSMQTNVCIICPEHGEFWQRPVVHLRGGGCPNCFGFRKEYKLSLLVEDDIQRSLTDSRFFCLKGLDIYRLIMTGVLPQDFMSIARTPCGSRERLSAMQILSASLSNNEEEREESVGDSLVEVDSIETIRQIQDIDDDDSSLIVDELTGLPILNSHKSIVRNGDVPGLDTIDPTSENGRGIVENTLQSWLQAVSDNPEFVDEIRNYNGSKFYGYIKELFFTAYNAISKIKNPEGYSFIHELYPYQKYLAYKLETSNSYSLWLEMGGGKTNCALFASRHNHLKNSIVIAPKSVLFETWVSSIYEIFPDSKVIAFFGENIDEFKVDGNDAYNMWLDKHLTVVHRISDFDGFGSGYNYLLINYDKFSQFYAKKLGEHLADSCEVNYVILDEVQNVKYRESTGDMSERHIQVKYLLNRIRLHNPNVKTTALTGTPLLNELSEVKSIIELVTGEEVSGIKNNRVSLSNVSEANKALVINGFRYCPSISVKHIVTTPQIKCTPELERTIRNLANRKSFYGELEAALAIAKINSSEIIGEIKPGTIIYVLYPYKNSTASEIIRKVEALGYKVGSYFGCTVNKHQAFDDFVNGKTDVLVASSPISEGVDGLQNRCDRMVIISLPQTYGRYNQLIKRIVRKRKHDSELQNKEVTIIVPQIVVELNNSKEGDDSEWSWDVSRWNAIMYKKNLGDAVMDGDIQKVFKIDWNKLYRNAMKVFKEGVKDEAAIQKNRIVVEVTGTERVVRERASSIVNEVHWLANRSNHYTTHQRFLENPDEFQKYHEHRELIKSGWIEDPVDRLASFINKHYKNKKIADLGCGVNKLSTLMTNENSVIGFDHQQPKDHKEVIVADMANLHGIVADSEMDIAIYCLSLWGKDYVDYFKEANRILKNHGMLFIVEPISDFGEGKRFGDKAEFINIIEEHRFVRLGTVIERNNFAYFRFIKED